MVRLKGNVGYRVKSKRGTTINNQELLCPNKAQPVQKMHKFKLKASMPHVKKPVGKTKFNQLTNLRRGLFPFDEDICLVDRSEEITNGNIVVAFVNGGLTVKQIDLSTRDKGYLRLMPANPKYKPIIIDANDQFILQGKVTSIHRDTRKY